MKMFSKHLVVYKYLLNNYSMPASFQPQGTEQEGPAPTLLEKDSSHINKHIHSVSPGVVLTVKNKGGGGEVKSTCRRGGLPAQPRECGLCTASSCRPLQDLPHRRQPPPEAPAFPGQPPSGSSATWPGEAEPFGPLRDL